MPVPFYGATAEQLVAVVEAVLVKGGPTDTEFVAQFADVPAEQAKAALNLAVELQLLQLSTSGYTAIGPLARPLASPDEIQRASALRIIVESYSPFLHFRDRLSAAPSASAAAHQVKTLLDLDAHRDVIRDMLLSLGTYSQALRTEGGGRYRASEDALQNALVTVAGGIADMVRAEAAVREAIGAEAAASISREEVILPLAEGLLRGSRGDATGAVVHAGNAVESFLVEVANRRTIDLTGATGVNAKVDRLRLPALLPTKLVNMGKYLGHIRNAADHGIDAEVGTSWEIRDSTGREYPLVACSFIANTLAREGNRPSII
jgi:hypothetical protein